MEISWLEFKKFVIDRGLSIQYVEVKGNYWMKAFDGFFEVECLLPLSQENSDTLDFEANFKAKGNKRLEQKTSTSINKVSIYEAEGDASTAVSHNYADPSSWFTGSLPVVNEVLTLDTGTTFKSAHPYWIDLRNGRCYDEDNIMLANANKWEIKIYIDGILQTSGYTLDVKAGKVTFSSLPAGTVTASYYYADKSYFVVKPRPGKVLSIKAAEVQFTTDIQIKSPFIFEAWVNHPVYGYIPVPGSQIAYKNAKDFVSACNEGQGLIPAWDGLLDVHVFPFNYARPKPIKSSQGVEIRVYIKDHKPVSGQFATATFYIISEPEEVV